MKKSRITEHEVCNLYQRALEANLDGLDRLADFPPSRLADIYNGIGPEFFPTDLRARVSRHLALFAPAALIHDFDNEFSDGSEAKFHEANLRFLENCEKLVDRAIPWYRPSRYIAKAAAFAMFQFVESQAGWLAWLAAQNAHQRKSANPNPPN